MTFLATGKIVTLSQGGVGVPVIPHGGALFTMCVIPILFQCNQSFFNHRFICVCLVSVQSVISQLWLYLCLFGFVQSGTVIVETTFVCHFQGSRRGELGKTILFPEHEQNNS